MTRIPGFRLRIVPAFVCVFFGAACVLGGVARIGVMSFAYSRHGLLATGPDTPSTNLVVISTRNLASVFASILVGTALLWFGVRLWPPWHQADRD